MCPIFLSFPHCLGLNSFFFLPLQASVFTTSPKLYQMKENENEKMMSEHHFHKNVFILSWPFLVSSKFFIFQDDDFQIWSIIELYFENML